MVYALDPRLAADTIYVASLAVSELLIMDDARYPWVVLVPRVENARELHEMDGADGAAAWAEITAVSAAVGAWSGVAKVNMGALGNMVPQLHIHVVGRHDDDPAWPGPVWGHSPRVPYREGEADRFSAYLLSALTSLANKRLL